MEHGGNPTFVGYRIYVIEQRASKKTNAVEEAQLGQIGKVSSTGDQGRSGGPRGNVYSWLLCAYIVHIEKDICTCICRHTYLYIYYVHICIDMPPLSDTNN